MCQFHIQQRVSETLANLPEKQVMQISLRSSGKLVAASRSIFTIKPKPRYCSAGGARRVMCAGQSVDSKLQELYNITKAAILNNNDLDVESIRQSLGDGPMPSTQGTIP